MANFKFDGKTIHVSGDLSISECHSLYNFLLHLPVAGDEIVVNLSRAEIWDSSTAQIFVSWRKALKRNIVWKNIPQDMKNDFRLMGLTTLFKEEEK